MTYGSSAHWDAVFADRWQRGDDLDWGDQWTPAFVPTLKAHRVRRVLELGCGTGNDALRLARHGFAVTALDFSEEAIRQARLKGTEVTFMVADIAAPLAFADSQIDAVMSNVALHMFSDVDTRRIFREVERTLRPDGLFVFHVNSTDDMDLRERNHPRAFEIEPGFYREADGQTMRFFSRAYLEDLLQPFQQLSLEHVEIAHHHTGAPFKRVWRAICRRPSRAA